MPGGRPAYAICMCVGGAPGGALPAADVVGAGPEGSGAAPGSPEEAPSEEGALPSAPAAAPLYCAGSAYCI
jgi:hypothetical protein